MEDWFKLGNQVGVTMVASSRSRATEVYRLNDGRLLLVEHLKSGRDVVSIVEKIPEYLTVRYNPPVDPGRLLIEYVSR